MSGHEAMAIVALFFLGYNELINWFHAQHPDGKGLIFVEVIGGTLAILIINAFVTTHEHYYVSFRGQFYYLSERAESSWTMFQLFVVAGIPMSIGAILRHVNKIVK